MAKSLQSCTSRRVQFSLTVTNPPGKETKALHHHANEQYYHRMVESEKKIWIEAKTQAQVEIELSKEDPLNVQRRVKFEDGVKTLACKDFKMTKSHANKGYYHRMVEVEKMAWDEAKKK